MIRVTWTARLALASPTPKIIGTLAAKATHPDEKAKLAGLLAPESKEVLTAYLQQLRANPNPGPLQPRLAKVFPDLNAALNKHLAKWEAEKSAGPTVERF